MVLVLIALLLAAAPPAPLSRLESLSEDLFDKAGDVRGEKRLFASLERELKRLRPGALVPAARIEEARARLRKAQSAAAAHDLQGEREAANRLCETVVAMLAAHEPPAQARLRTLDVLLRDVLLAAWAGEPARAQPVLEEARTVWRAAGAAPPLASGKAPAQFDEALAEVAASITAADAPRLAKAAKAGLDAVDALEAALAAGMAGK